MYDCDPWRFCKALWGYLNLTVHGESRIIFNNVEELNGLEGVVTKWIPNSATRRDDGGRWGVEVDGRMLALLPKNLARLGRWHASTLVTSGSVIS